MLKAHRARVRGTSYVCRLKGLGFKAYVGVSRTSWRLWQVFLVMQVTVGINSVLNA